MTDKQTHTTARTSLPLRARDCHADAAAQQWPGLRAWVRLHWQGQLSLPRTVLVSFCLSQAPVFYGLFPLAMALQFLLGEWNRANDQLGNLLMPLWVSGMVWWAVGIHRKCLRLLEQSRLAMAAVAFLMELLAWWMLGAMCYDALRPHLRPPSYLSRLEEYCRRADDDWVSQPWSVMAMPELNRIVARGSIGEGSARVLQQVLQQHPQLRLLELDSPGGLVREQWQLQEIIRSHRLDTLVLELCNSACTALFLAGERRYVGSHARFGFHRSGYCGMRPNMPWSTNEYMTYIDYRARGVDEAFAQQALDTPYHSLRIAWPIDLKRAGFATHWWSDRPPEYGGLKP